MKKKITAVILAFALSFGALSGAAQAQEAGSAAAHAPAVQQEPVLPAGGIEVRPAPGDEDPSRLAEGAPEEAGASSITAPETAIPAGQSGELEVSESAPKEVDGIVGQADVSPADAAQPEEGSGAVFSTPEPQADNEVEYSVDGGLSWNAGSFSDAVTAIHADPGASAQIRLTAKEIEIDRTYTFSKTVTVDGASVSGGTLVRAAGFTDGALFKVERSGALTLTGVTLDGGAKADPAGAWSGVQAAAPLIEVTGGALTLDGNAVLQGAWSTGNGGAVALQGGTLTIQGGSAIRNSRAVSGGGIYATGDAGFVSIGGSSSIAGNAAEQNGGGVFLGENVQLKTIVSGGNTAETVATVEKNTAGANGGGLYVTDQENNISNMKLAENRAQNGGAAYVAGGKLVTDGAANVIEKNEALQNGGAVYIQAGSVSFGNTAVRENRAQNGGGLYLQAGSATLNVAQLLENMAQANGGGAYLAAGTLTLTNGAGSAGVQNNQAQAGGGLYLADGGSAAVQIGSGSSSGTVDICGNTATGAGAEAAGGIYLGETTSFRVQNNASVNVKSNRADGGSGSLGDDWAAEDACGGIFLSDGAEMSLRGNVVITDNTVAAGKRPVNLLIENQADGTRAVMLVNNQWNKGLSASSKIGVSLTHWPKNGQFFQILGNYTDPNPTGNISSEFEKYFTSDRSPYDSAGTSAPGFEVVVNTQEAYPEGELAQAHANKVYLTRTGRQPATAAAAIENKVYDGTSAATAGAVTWSGIAAEDQEAFDDLALGTGYTVTASFDGEDGNVAYDPAGDATAQPVTGTITLLDPELAEKYPELAQGCAFQATAVITPAPLTASIAVSDKYYDGSDSAAVQSMTFSGLVGGDTLTEGTDYTVADAVFDEATAAETVRASATVTGLTGSDVLKNYTLYKEPVTATGSAKIWPLPVVVSFGADDRDHVAGDTSAAVTVGTVSVRLADAPEAGAPALPSSLPVSPVYQKDFDLENVRFVDADGTPTDQVGTHQVTATVVPMGEDASNYVWKGVEPASATIRGIELTASAAAPDKTYDGTVNLVGDAAVTLTNGTVTLTQGTDFTVESAVFDHKDADDDAGVTIRIKLADEAAKIYTIRQTDHVVTDAATGVTTIQTTAKISQKEIKLASAVADDKKYDGTTAANVHDLVFEGLVPGEALAAGDYTYTASFEDPSAGDNKPVTVTAALQNTGTAKNYTLAQDTCTAYADIVDDTAAPVVLQGELTVQDKTYDGTTDVPVGSYTLTFTDEAGKTVTLTENTEYRVTSAPVFSEKNAGVRTVSMSIELLDAGRDYTLASELLTAQAEITKRPLVPSVVRVPDKIYDGSAQVVDAQDDPLEVALSGCISGEELLQGADYTVSGQFGSKDTEAPEDAAVGKPVTITVTLTDSALAQNYELSPAVIAGSADITPRPLSISHAAAADKLYDGKTDARVTALSFSNTLEGEPLERDVDWRVVSAQFDTADTGLEKPVHVAVELMDSERSKNYALAQDRIDTTADITNHLDMNGAYTGEVSSGPLTADEIDGWIRETFTDVLAGKPQVTFKDQDGKELSGIDKSQAGVYTVEATYSDGNGQTATYRIQWTLTEKSAPDQPAPPASSSEPPATAPVGVQTGDNFPLALLVIGFTLALTGIVVILIIDHKRKQDRK